MAKTPSLEGTNLAAAKAEEGKLEEAISLFRQALQQGPQPAAVHESLAQCLNEVGDYEDARHAASVATEFRPQEVGTEDCQALQEEMQEIELLWQQQVARRVGLPHLRISQRLGSSMGPGAVVWECGLCLTEYLALNSALVAGKRFDFPDKLQSFCSELDHNKIQCVAILVYETTHPSEVVLAHGWSDVQSGEQFAELHSGYRVVEQGSGTGIAGIAAALLGASKVTLTDLPPLLPLLDLNVRQNGLHSPGVVSAALDWDEPAGSLTGSHQGYEVVLASDPVYATSQVPGFAAVLSCLVGKGGIGLLAHKHRHAEVDTALFDALSAAGCLWEQKGVSSKDPHVRVYELRKT